MTREFLGTGWRFPVRTNERGAIELSSGERDVEEAIRLILSTAPGERVMRPEFGCGIHEFAFATIDRTTLTQVETRVEEALVRWEPRIEVLDIEASTENVHAGELLIRVAYRVRQTNVEDNLVYPFSLEEI